MQNQEIILMRKFLNAKILSSRDYPDFFPIKPYERVINIGCGIGPQAVVYANNFQEMIGVDINSDKLNISKNTLSEIGVKNYITLCANVESIPLPDKSFDKALAIDIIEHVINPEKFCREANRLLKENGEMLITFPAMHDKYLSLFSFIGKLIGRKKKEMSKGIDGWNPDKHNHDYSLVKWINLVSGCGFELKKSKATTIFPPLHLYGVPKFWFSNGIIHWLDRQICCLPLIKNFGATLMVVFIKKSV
jgi:2-polyprenyl-3-methyl-5-hydroxy-6-metoxy-1,4-benzoquinol methylase